MKPSELGAMMRTLEASFPELGLQLGVRGGITRTENNKRYVLTCSKLRTATGELAIVQLPQPIRDVVEVARLLHELKEEHAPKSKKASGIIIETWESCNG